MTADPSTTDAATPGAAALGWMARRGVAPQWRSFLRALLETLDTNLDPDSRNSMLRAVGGRLAAAYPLPAAETLVELEAAMNTALLASDWGFVSIKADGEASALFLTHGGAPAVGYGSDAEGAWVGAMLEGLYGSWIGEQPGADASMPVKVDTATAGRIVLRYGR